MKDYRCEIYFGFSCKDTKEFFKKTREYLKYISKLKDEELEEDLTYWTLDD